ncbi:hypothetical protein [Streptomyces sp. Ag109_O5-10]|uniref:hypothetical protein n=1 Tax=Streptomyces sp. Ag109_O5-10 TaxID=1855349 RepID=UPI0015A65681|nr:hypothetical protein [Streptomyces sp. Ag109_O5-10]
MHAACGLELDLVIEHGLGARLIHAVNHVPGNGLHSIAEPYDADSERCALGA